MATTPKKKVAKSKKVPIKRDKKGRLVPGHGLKSPGRPVGSISIIGRIKQIFEEEPELFESYVRDVVKDKFMRKELVQQIDGKPKDRIEHSGSIGNYDMENLSDDELDRIIAAGERS